MKKFFKKKVVLILLVILLAGSGVAGYILFFNNSSGSTKTETVTELKVDSLFGYLGTETNYSKFNALVGMFDSAKYLVKNEAGLDPSLIVFAPGNAAFEKTELKVLESMNMSGRDQIKLYHIARVYPSAAGVSANLELADGQKVQTLLNREIVVKKDAQKTYLIDGKGRQANISSKYATTSKGDRIYFIDNVLLFQ